MNVKGKALSPDVHICGSCNNSFTVPPNGVKCAECGEFCCSVMCANKCAYKNKNGTSEHGGSSSASKLTASRVAAKKRLQEEYELEVKKAALRRRLEENRLKAELEAIEVEHNRKRLSEDVQREEEQLPCSQDSSEHVQSPPRKRGASPSVIGAAQKQSPIPISASVATPEVGVAPLTRENVAAIQSAHESSKQPEKRYVPNESTCPKPSAGRNKH